MMKLKVLTLALAATALGSLSAGAQTTVIEDRPPSAVVIEQPPPVVIERAPSSSTTTIERGGFLGTETKTTTETTGTGPNGDCTTRSVHKEDLGGERTVTRTDCQ
jgi:hypothetical protein